MFLMLCNILAKNSLFDEILISKFENLWDACQRSENCQKMISHYQCIIKNHKEEFLNNYLNHLKEDILGSCAPSNDSTIYEIEIQNIHSGYFRDSVAIIKRYVIESLINYVFNEGPTETGSLFYKIKKYKFSENNIENLKSVIISKIQGIRGECENCKNIFKQCYESEENGMCRVDNRTNHVFFILVTCNDWPLICAKRLIERFESALSDITSHSYSIIMLGNYCGTQGDSINKGDLNSCQKFNGSSRIEKIEFSRKNKKIQGIVRVTNFLCGKYVEYPSEYHNISFSTNMKNLQDLKISPKDSLYFQFLIDFEIVFQLKRTWKNGQLQYKIFFKEKDEKGQPKDVKIETLEAFDYKSSKKSDWSINLTENPDGSYLNLETHFTKSFDFEEIDTVESFSANPKFVKIIKVLEYHFKILYYSKTWNFKNMELINNDLEPYNLLSFRHRRCILCLKSNFDPQTKNLHKKIQNFLKYYGLVVKKYKRLDFERSKDGCGEISKKMCSLEFFQKKLLGKWQDITEPLKLIPQKILIMAESNEKIEHMVVITCIETPGIVFYDFKGLVAEKMAEKITQLICARRSALNKKNNQHYKCHVNDFLNFLRKSIECHEASVGKVYKVVQRQAIKEIISVAFIEHRHNLRLQTTEQNSESSDEKRGILEIFMSDHQYLVNAIYQVMCEKTPFFLFLDIYRSTMVQKYFPSFNQSAWEQALNDLNNTL